jgi:hypothetical protein
MKRGKGMLLISKETAHELHDKYGIRFKDGGISKSATKHPKYYLCESERNLKLLLKIAPNEKVEQLLKVIREQKKLNAENTEY